jgi:hypothetical protein
MGLRVAARLFTLSEAEVAASVLRSAGLSPVVFDEHYGRMDWVAQAALGGYRVMLPEEELADGVALLRSTPEPDPLPEADRIETQASETVAVAAMAGLVIGGGVTGWAVQGLRRRPGWMRLGAGLIILMVLVSGGYLLWLRAGGAPGLD